MDINIFKQNSKNRLDSIESEIISLGYKIQNQIKVILENENINKLKTLENKYFELMKISSRNIIPKTFPFDFFLNYNAEKDIQMFSKIEHERFFNVFTQYKNNVYQTNIEKEQAEISLKLKIDLLIKDIERIEISRQIFLSQLEELELFLH